MDREDLIALKVLLDKILWREPTEEELDYDEDKIAMYANLHNLRDSMEKLGF